MEDGSVQQFPRIGFTTYAGLMKVRKGGDIDYDMINVPLECGVKK